MRAFTGETFSQLFDRGDQLRLQGLNLSGCAFINCGLSLTEDVARIAEIQDIQINDCTVSGCSIGPLVASDVTISDLSTDGLLILWSPYLRHVEMKGEMGRIKINATARPSTFENEKQKPFDDYRSGFYADVDWALDISKARFKEFDIDGVPSRLVRRDPESQVVVTRERALQVATTGWESKLRCIDTHLPFTINLFLSDGDSELILVAPLGAAKAERDSMLQGLRELRAIGLAEPD